uniref:dienelactone hydrolase family protein n=1 Tax=Falsiroseomonas oryziterrae TaxID=2911368 RepID=UPI001F355BBB
GASPAPGRAAPVAERRPRTLALALALALGLAAPAGARAEFALPRALSDTDGVVGLISRPPMPPGGPQRLPAVLLVHDSLGYDSRSEVYTRQLLGASLPVAEVELQVLSSDGVIAPEEETGRLRRALAALAAAPGIDPDRIGAIGFGEGARALVLESDGLPLRAVVLLYPGCGTLASELGGGDPQPSQPFGAVLLMHGTADPANPANGCVALAGLLAERTPDVRLQAWAGASYGWDIPDGIGASNFRYPAPGDGPPIRIEPWPELADLSAARAAAFLHTSLAGTER